MNKPFVEDVAELKPQLFDDKLLDVPQASFLALKGADVPHASPVDVEDDVGTEPKRLPPPPESKPDRT